MSATRALVALCVLTVASADCYSKLTKDCGTAAGDACAKCAESHQQDLSQAGCTHTEIDAFCGDSTCAKEFIKDCRVKDRKDKQSCLKCTQTHKADLEKATCTEAEVDSLCGGGPSPGPGPAPPGPGPAPPGPGPAPPGPGPAPPAGDVLNKVLLDNSDASAVGGRCLDGSDAGYHYAAAKPSATNKWVIDVKGGGACTTHKTCDAFSKSSKGSSKRWGATIQGENVYDGNPATNPDFYDWNRVRIGYCTGDLHTGQRTGPSAETWNFWFDGHLNFQRIIADLKTKGLGNATDVLLSGNSAGGYGAFIHADYLASQLPSATVKAAPQAGWFSPEDPAATPKGAGFPLNFTAKEVTHQTASNIMGSAARLQLYQGYTPPACLAAYPKATAALYCGSVHNLYPHITIPVLVIENQYDTAQIYTDGAQCPKHPQGKEVAEVADFISYYGALMRKSIGEQIKAHGQTKAKGNDGAFLPSCLSHEVSLDTTLPVAVSASGSENDTAAADLSTNVTQVGFIELIGDWYYERNKFASHILIDDCKMTDGQACNPVCPEK